MYHKRTASTSSDKEKLKDNIYNICSKNKEVKIL